MSTKSSRTGRPAESKNVKRDQADVHPSRCRKCGSTNRTKYFGQNNELEYGGVTADGKPYTHIVRKKTACADCGQHRRDAVYENRPKTGSKAGK